MRILVEILGFGVVVGNWTFESSDPNQGRGVENLKLATVEAYDTLLTQKL